MLEKVSIPTYGVREEIAQAVIHGIGILLAIVALAVLTSYASVFGTTRHIVGCSIYGATLILLYASSTLYHSVQYRPAKKMLRVLDHAAIFFLIAGTYTPFLLISMRGPLGWSFFGVIWGLTAVGIVVQLFLLSRNHGTLTVALYIAMGWLIVPIIKPLIAAIPPVGFVYLIAGGLAYTLGIAFYAWKKLPYNHAIWHGFVLAGSIFHFFSVFYSVIPSVA
ncbi:MAG: hemolysin III family protein [Spirochaetes bacterium]|nr:hemolysin III family protein [Spirochaetota bacterium]